MVADAAGRIAASPRSVTHFRPTEPFCRAEHLYIVVPFRTRRLESSSADNTLKHSGLYRSTDC
jgi:hypothetical protein